jgi:signal transduction histidine kinase
MKIRQQFSVLFFIITFVLISIISVVLYYYGRNMLLKEKYLHLESISETKEIRVIETIKKKYELVNFLNDIISSHIDWKEFKNSVPEKQRDFLLPLKLFLGKLKSVKKIDILNAKGTIVSSTDTSLVWNKPLRKKSNSSDMVFMDRVYMNKDKELILTFYSPLYYEEKKIGTLIIDLNASDLISLTNNYTGLGATGETVLVQKNGIITFITPPRFSAGPKINIYYDTIAHDQVITHAFENKGGLLLNHYDYRGEKVIASIRLLKDLEWAVITKIDEKEAMKPVKNLQKIMMTIGIVEFLATIIIAYFIGGYFAKPITDLTDCVHKIKEGDLSLKINIKSKNEIGTLAETFNEMTVQLEEKMKELKLSNESLNKFAYVISHDLKAPAQSIQSLAGILREEYQGKKLDEEGKKILEMMVLKSTHMEELIEGVLESAKSGFKAKEKEIINTNILIKNVLENLNPPLHIKIKIQENLPFVYYNKVSLIQVFQNLISNSLKYIDKPTGLIEIGAVSLENKIKFFVKDNGTGINESDYSKIFMMFGTTKEDKKVESHGIGLSTVKHIVTENNGEIWLESKPGEGTTFYFTIPKN